MSSDNILQKLYFLLVFSCFYDEKCYFQWSFLTFMMENDTICGSLLPYYFLVAFAYFAFEKCYFLVVICYFSSSCNLFQPHSTTFKWKIQLLTSLSATIQPPILLFLVVFHYLDATNPQLWLLLSWETLLFSDILPRFHC